MKSSETISYAERVDKFWRWFERHSDKMESLNNGKGRDMNKLNDLLAQGVQTIGDNVYYNIGGDNELTFCVEDCTECFYLYPWLVASMSDSLRAKWTVYPCKQPSKPDFGLRIFDQDINVADIKYSAEFDSERRYFILSCYHPALFRLSEAESVHALYVILEMILGEGVVYNYIGDVYLADNDKGMAPVDGLSEAVKATVESNGIEYHTEPYLPFYTYKGNPDPDSKSVRSDIIAGSSRYMALNNEYLNGERNIYDSLDEKGATAIMLILTQPEGMETNDFLKLRYGIEDYLTSLFDASAQKGMYLGSAYGASGLAYIDLLLFDAHKFLSDISEDINIGAILTPAAFEPAQLMFKTFAPDSEVYLLR
ncbi:MAG: hypothetical protein K2I39_05230 [Muribaculaceae bacterium]|nr:hypothetical protein [Muribaculaceae bacterium]